MISNKRISPRKLRKAQMDLNKEFLDDLKRMGLRTGVPLGSQNQAGINKIKGEK